jgi:thiamine-phosphate pyrophosphorylase
VTPCPQLRQGLYLVLTHPAAGYETLTEMAVMAQLPAVQFRPKARPGLTLDDAELLRMACVLRELTRGSDTLFIVNDRPELAVESNADGVHVGQTDCSPAEARHIVGDHRLVGLSTHNLDQVAASTSDPIDYIGFGPLYATHSKLNPDPVTGTGPLARAAELAPHPIVAIGGLTLERIQALDASAFHCAAVIRAVTEAENPLQAMREFQTILTSST